LDYNAYEKKIDKFIVFQMCGIVIRSVCKSPIFNSANIVITNNMQG